MRVVIAGAGLGGLCLAHGLRRGGMDVVVLERHPTPDARPASYGIHLNADGLRALHACLPAENWARLVTTSTPAPDVVRFHDQDLRVLAERDHTGTPANADPVTRRRAVNRDALRDALLLGCNGLIRWGTAFDRFEYTGDGVRVHTADGQAIDADLLVGADGANSRVREQRLPDLRRQDLGIVNIAGRVRPRPASRAPCRRRSSTAPSTTSCPRGPAGCSCPLGTPAPTRGTWCGRGPRTARPTRATSAPPSPPACASWSGTGPRPGRPRSGG